jgi:magnesium-transporting ATPase (P-type)
MDIPKATAIPLLNTTSAGSANNYDYSKIKTPLIYATFIIVMLVLISVVVGLIYSKSAQLPGAPTLTQKENDTAMMIISFTLAILLIVFMTIPNYKDFLTFIGKIKFVLLLAGYIIGLIVLYRNVPRGIVDAYSFLF